MIKHFAFFITGIALLPTLPFTAICLICRTVNGVARRAEVWCGRNFYYPILQWARRIAGKPVWQIQDLFEMGIPAPTEALAAAARAGASVAMQRCAACELQVDHLHGVCCACTDKAKTPTPEVAA